MDDDLTPQAASDTEARARQVLAAIIVAEAKRQNPDVWMDHLSEGELIVNDWQNDRHPYRFHSQHAPLDAMGFAAAVATFAASERAAGVREGLEMAAGVAENPGFIQARDTEWDQGVNDAKRLIAQSIRSKIQEPK